MHAEWRAMLYQSHRLRRAKKKIFHVAPSRPILSMQSQTMKRRPRASAQSAIAGCCGANGALTCAQALIVFDHFRSWRIYNKSCEISRERDLWRLSMMLSSFLVVAPQSENFKAASRI